MTKRRIALLIGFVLFLWWLWIAPVLADSQWWDPLTTQIVGTTIIVALAGLLMVYGRQTGTMLIATATTVLGNRRARWATFALVVLVFLITKWEDIPWWWSDFRDSLGSVASEIGFWLEPIFWGEAWDRLVIVVFGTGALIWGIRRAGGIRRTLGTVANAVKTIPAIGGLLVFRKWWQMEVGYRVGVAVLSILAVIYTINGSLLNLMVVAAVWVVAAFRGWPRENPLDPTPVGPFYLPVLKALGFGDYTFLILVCLVILTSGITCFLVSGYQMWVMAVTFAATQIFFLWYVDKRPGTANAWTKARVVPKDQVLILDQRLGLTGEARLVPLKLGPIGMKERKGMADNLLRLFGYYLFEFEPMGLRPEPGETLGKLEVYIQCGHFRFHHADETWKGPDAFINYVASL